MQVTPCVSLHHCMSFEHSCVALDFGTGVVVLHLSGVKLAHRIYASLNGEPRMTLLLLLSSVDLENMTVVLLAPEAPVPITL